MTSGTKHAGGERPSAWIWVAFAILAAYSAILWVEVPLIDPDEGLHAAIAQEMVERGDWVTPRVLGEPFFDKPILYFWALCCSLSLFGMNENSVRVPGLLFGLMTVASSWYAARKWFGVRAGKFAGCIQATMLLPLATSQIAVHDVPLVAWTVGAIGALWSIHRSGSPGISEWKSVASACLFLGLAILTKGLIGVAFVMLAYVPAALLTKRLPLLRMATLLLATGIGGLLISSPWFLLMEWKNPGYLEYYFYQRHIVGFLSPTKWHGSREWWYYLPILIGGSLPWGGYLAGAGRQFWSDFRSESRPAGQHERILLWCWLGMGVLFLSLAKAKLASYCLPLFPPIAMLVGDFWDRGLRGELQSGALRDLRFSASAFSWTGLIAFPVVCGGAIAYGLLDYSTELVVVSAIITLIGVSAIRSALRANWERVFAGGVLTLTALGVGTIIEILPAAAEGLSGRPLAGYLNDRFEPGGELILLRERIGSVLFYLDPEVRRGLSTAQVSTKTIREFIETFSAKESQWVVIPEREVPLILHYVEFSHLPYETRDRYRIYRGSGFVPLHVRRIPPAPNGIMAN